MTAEIIRELQIVQSLSAGIELAVDPAEGANYQRALEIGEINQEVAKIQAEMRLAQARRNVELLRDQLEKQNTIEDIAEPIEPVTVDSDVEAPESKSILELLEATKKVLTELLTAEGDVAPMDREIDNVNVIDKFNYQMACRDTIKNVINRTRLDELHDLDGNALVRLQVRATVLPGEEGYEDTLGILRMEIVPPVFDNAQSPRVVQIYRTWLGYVNRSINLPPEQDPDRTDPRIRTARRFMALSQYYDLRYLELPKWGETGGDRPCAGLQTTELSPERCWYVRVALPTGSDVSVLDRIDSDPDSLDDLVRSLNGAEEGIRESGHSLDATCDIDSLRDDEAGRFAQRGYPDVKGFTTKEAVEKSIDILALWQLSASTIADSIEESIRHLSSTEGSDATNIVSEIEQYLQRTFAAGLADLGNAANGVLEAVGGRSSVCNLGIRVPRRFLQAIRGSTQRVAAYDVRPAERVQAVSTLARAADTVSLVGSIAGMLPGQGAGAGADIGALRSVIGRADALEMAPVVVGFAEPATVRESGDSQRSEGRETPPSFGWLLGPKAVLDAEEQELKFVHPVKPYDLYADLSLPGWWPRFGVRAFTAWAPDWAHAGNTGRTMNTSEESLDRLVEIPMVHNAGDMDGLSALLAKAADIPVLNAPRIMGVEPSEVSARLIRAGVEELAELRL
ncbi:MAG: hypothetical protein OXP36_10205, partial [Gammaproteobacteria bacterium]|nr:hypothetical protein [Gammaproteobacteria bacterium]